MHGFPRMAAVLGSLGLLAAPPSPAAERCHAEQSGPPPRVVELFTSEGCSSCPPADRWLSTLRGRSDVIALAFHVDYWDRLGWTDRFAQAAFTARQYRLQESAGAGFVYTPQVLVDGRDWRRWPALPERATATGPSVAVTREGRAVTAVVGAAPAARLAAYWAVTEDGHETAVKQGENRGQVLRHDAVTRVFQAVPAWSADTARTLTWTLPSDVSQRPHRLVLVITTGDGARPLQALSLACPAA